MTHARELCLFLAVATSQLQGQVTCSGVTVQLGHAVYVSPTGADGNGCGSSATAPCQTIQQGIRNCTGAGCGVLVRYGLYRVTAPVALANGVSVYGSCTFDGSSLPSRTVVAGPSPVITASQITSPTTMHGLVVMADNATNPGQASIAMTVSNSTGLTFSHNVLASGKGGDGTPGAYADGGPGGGGGTPQGDSGGLGGQACAANPSPSDGDGGQGADIQQVYSHGCFWWCACDNNNYPNSLGRQGHASGNVLGGGGGQRGGPGCNCASGAWAAGDAGDGPPGAPGNPGGCGVQGGTTSSNTVGTFTQTAWTPGIGGAGDAGKVGSGGGGGGSGGFATSGIDYHGKPGGGGGGGGCGGPGGGGGGQGGASIPLVLAGSTVQELPLTNVLIPGPGGRGGNGATGGKGGPGGPGNTGAPGHQFLVQESFCSGTAPGTGGKGGDGGQGGAGSGGAGGNGGPSFGIALVGSPVNFGGSVRIYPANPGAGGSGAAGGQNTSSQCQGAKGQDGQAGFANDNNSVVTYQ